MPHSDGRIYTTSEFAERKLRLSPVCTENLNSGVVVMESAKDGV